MPSRRPLFTGHEPAGREEGLFHPDVVDSCFRPCPLCRVKKSASHFAVKGLEHVSMPSIHRLSGAGRLDVMGARGSHGRQWESERTLPRSARYAKDNHRVGRGSGPPDSVGLIPVQYPGQGLVIGPP